MQLTVDPRGAAELRATAAYLTAMADIAAKRETAAPARIGHAVIKPEDNPETGAPLPPAAPVPTPDLAAAARAFGGAPVAPSVPIPPPAAPVAPASALPVPPVVSPAAVPPVGAANPAGKQLDGRGLPWDARIHSTPGTLTDKGVWRKKRGLNDEGLVRRIEAELLAAQGVPAPAVPVPPGAPAAVPVPPVVTGPADLPGMLQAATPLMAAGQLDMARVLEACKAVGVESLTALQSRPDLVPGVWVEVQKRVTTA